VTERTWTALGARSPRSDAEPEARRPAAEFEAAWLEEQWRSEGEAFGAVGAALAAAIPGARTLHARDRLCVALLAERARVLALAGAWGNALRHRQEVSLFEALGVDTAAAAQEFYAVVRASRARSLVALFGLPEEVAVVRALTAVTGWTEGVCRRSLRDGVAHAKLLAGAYDRQDEPFRRLGAAVVHRRGSSERELQVLAEGGEPMPARVDRATVRVAESEIAAAATFLRYLAALSRALASPGQP
jgi:hypothetical protein